MATITVCPPDTIEALEAAPVAWLWDPRETTHLDKLARETIAGLNQPPPCDDAIGDDGEDVYADLRDPGDEFYIDLTTGEVHRCDEDEGEEDRCPFGGDHTRGVLCYEVCGLDEPTPEDDTPILAEIGPLPATPWLERRAAELLASMDHEECVSCSKVGAWPSEGEAGYPLCPDCKAVAVAEADAAAAEYDYLEPFASGTWPRIPAPFGGDE